MSPLISAPNASQALPYLLDALMSAPVQDSRNGETREVLYPRIVLTDAHRPYVTTPGRKASLPAQIAETMWILAGRDDVAWLSHYLPQAARFSDDGEVWAGGYGPRMRRWSAGDTPHTRMSFNHPQSVDQLQHVIDLLREDPDTRRAVVNLYDPASDSAGGLDVPCNNWLHFLVRGGKIHLHVATRSNDAMWGWSGINAFEWSILLQVVAEYTGFRTGSIHFSISSLHLYERHFDKAQRILDQTLFEDNDLDSGHWLEMGDCAPSFAPSGESLDHLIREWFTVEALIREGHGGRHVEIATYPEPMFRSWLLVLDSWWNGSEFLGYQGTDLEAALNESPRRKVQEDVFLRDVLALHHDKGKAYGGSWKKRGEQLSILPNIARKIDRLGVAGAGDTAADTAIDLMVYLAKYRQWMMGANDEQIEAVLKETDTVLDSFDPQATARHLVTAFDTRLTSEKRMSHRLRLVEDEMLPQAQALARYLAREEGWSYDAE